MENTLEEKAKFFAQYYNQVVMGEIETNYHPLDRSVVDNYNISGSLRRGAFKNAFIELTGLSSITNEDAIEVCNIFRGEGVDNSGGLSLSFCNRYMSRIIQSTGAYQYLQSKGYALPFQDLTIEQLIEYGWITLKTNNK